MQPQNTNPGSKDDIKNNNAGDTSNVQPEKEGSEDEKTDKKHDHLSPKK